MKKLSLALALALTMSTAYSAERPNETTHWSKEVERKFEVTPTQAIAKDGSTTWIRNFKTQVVGEKLTQVGQECFLTKTIESGVQRVEYNLIENNDIKNRHIDIPVFKTEKNLAPCPN